LRGLPGDDSLARLLARHEGRELRPGPLTVEQILVWADAHHERTGGWPKSTSGAVADAPGETWSAINTALYSGFRGLAEGDTLACVLERHRGVERWQRRSG
jgi:hypothetical protein